MQNKYKLILASASARRAEILAYLGVDFKIQSSDVQEVTELTDPCEVVEFLAKLKAEAVYKTCTDENSLVVGSDTIVVYENEILGKPKGIDDARDTLLKLSGDSHEVITGVNITCRDFSFTFHVKTEVEFYKLQTSELEEYLKSGDSLDKAGAYGIQGQAQSFIKSLDGSYSNVVGFPIAEFIIHLKSLLNANDLKTKII